MASVYFKGLVAKGLTHLSGHNRDRLALWAQAVESSGATDTWPLAVRLLGDDREKFLQQYWGGPGG